MCKTFARIQYVLQSPVTVMSYPVTFVKPNIEGLSITVLNHELASKVRTVAPEVIL